MLRARGWFILGVVAMSLLCADMAQAQTPEPWPLAGLDYSTKPEDFPRGPGLYFSLPKLVSLWLLFLLWVAVADWVNRDTHELRFGAKKWNPLIVLTFLAAIIVGWALSSFWLAIILQVVALAVPLTIYVRQRNAIADIGDRVMTRKHLRRVFARAAGKIGIRIRSEGKERDESPVDLVAKGGATNQVNAANQLLARRMPGFVPMGVLLDDAIHRRATIVLLDYTPETVAIRYQIDGIWRELPSSTRAAGDEMLVVLKTLAALDPQQRSATQRGAIQIRQNKQNFDCRIATRGVSTGERVLLRIDDGVPHKARLHTIGMTDKQVEDSKRVVEASSGLILVSAPVSGGLTTLLTATTAAVDRFMRSAAAIEEASHRDLEVENVPVTTFNASAGEKPVDTLVQILRQYPDVIVAPNVTDPAIMERLCEEARGNRLVITSIAAHDAVGAMLRVGAMKAPWKSFVKSTTASINVRLIRKLCETCKEAYTPPDGVLQKLGLAGKVESLYRPPEPPPPTEKKPRKPPPPCATCGGNGYVGRTGMFEVLILDDTIRNVLVTTPKSEAVRAAARQAGMKSLQDDGIRLVGEGVTSLAEVTRVLKEKE